MIKAAVDVGSNSVLLIVERADAQSRKSILERSWVTGLGTGTKSTGLLEEDAMERTLGAVREAFSLAHAAGADSVVAAATMAARIARNTEDFLARATAQSTPIYVLPGDEEARLGFLAVANDPAFLSRNRITIVDVGGQSTEIATALRDGSGWKEEFRKSFSIGTLGLKSTSLRAECPTGAELLQAVVEIDDVLGICYRRGACGDAIALGATGTNLVSLREKLVEWDPERVHGQWLEFGEISQSVSYLYGMSEARRALLPGMEEGRGPTLPGGALILERCLDAIGAPGCYVSVRGWRHALLDREFEG
jgi:exopolyphosphatase/guanosine-5'-triphosphate,3'-diphosphate pyrophosphatase